MASEFAWSSFHRSKGAFCNMSKVYIALSALHDASHATPHAPPCVARHATPHAAPCAHLNTAPHANPSRYLARHQPKNGTVLGMTATWQQQVSCQTLPRAHAKERYAPWMSLRKHALGPGHGSDRVLASICQLYCLFLSSTGLDL